MSEGAIRVEGTSTWKYSLRILVMSSKGRTGMTKREKQRAGGRRKRASGGSSLFARMVGYMFAVLLAQVSENIIEDRQDRIHPALRYKEAHLARFQPSAMLRSPAPSLLPRIMQHN
jgi:hypothetical protein